MKLPIFKNVEELRANLVEHNSTKVYESLTKSGIKPSCKKGCASCCYRKIYVTLAEAIIIYREIKKKKILQEVLKDCKKNESIVSETDANSYFVMKIPCPLLNTKTNSCRVYSVRPVGCSTHWVLSSPKLCDPWNSTNAQYRPFQFNSIANSFYKIAARKNGTQALIRLPIQQALLIVDGMTKRQFASLEDFIIEAGKR
jgi:hypothetical protein